MYNKIFTKILDSSVWLEPTPTRIVWVTFLAAMDEHGFCPFAAPGNVAARARVTMDEARQALATLEAADPDSADPDFEGRRIERAAGGWIVLNAEKYRRIVSRAVQQEQTRERVRRHREKRKSEALPVTPTVTCHDRVTPSEAYTEARSEADQDQRTRSRRADRSRSLTVPDDFVTFWNAYPRKVGKPSALRAWSKQKPAIADVLAAIARTKWDVDPTFRPHPSTWLNDRRWEDAPPNTPPRPLLVNAHDWTDECIRLHHGECGHRAAHELVMMRGSA